MVFEKRKKKTDLNLTYDIEIDDPVICYTLYGKIISDLDFQDLEKDVFDHLNKNYYRIIFDLENLTHTNSSGIAFFMRTLTKARIMGGELILINLEGNVAKIFSVAKLDEVYTICKDKQEAKNHFKALQ